MKKLKIRVAKYKRVSTDEQKLKKNSIIAQDEILDDYIAKNPEMILVGDFSDEGVSGSKIKRTELQRLLEMVENDEVDLIIVTKLDRWFRNIAFYYKVQEVLERNNVAWKTILEDYNTLTADGKLKVNIMLSVAQNEVERTSERIKVVFESKVRHKQVVSGSVPFGFKIVDGNGGRKIVKDEKMIPLVEDALNLVFTKQNMRGVMYEINDKYNCDLKYDTFRRFLRNPILYGHHHGVDNFCEGYLTKEEFDRLQKITALNIKERKSKTYIFSGLIRCPECNKKLGGCVHHIVKKSGKRYVYLRYRCMNHSKYKTCKYTKSVSEMLIERQLLEQLKPRLEQVILESEIKEATPTPRVNITAVKEEIKRLNNMYQKGRIDDDEYDAQYEKLQAKLNSKPEVKKDYSELKKLLSSDIMTLYATFTPKEKQIFWRSIVDRIELNDDKYPTIYFL